MAAGYSVDAAARSPKKPLHSSKPTRDRTDRGSKQEDQRPSPGRLGCKTRWSLKTAFSAGLFPNSEMQRYDTCVVLSLPDESRMRCLLSDLTDHILLARE